MWNPAIILCRYKLAPTPPCAQTMHRTHSYTLLFPLWHVLEVFDRSCTDLAGLCQLESPLHWRALHLCQAQFLFKSQLSNVSSSQDTGPELQALSFWIFPCCHITPAEVLQPVRCSMSPALPSDIKAQFEKKIYVYRVLKQTTGNS